MSANQKRKKGIQIVVILSFLPNMTDNTSDCTPRAEGGFNQAVSQGL